MKEDNTDPWWDSLVASVVAFFSLILCNLDYEKFIEEDKSSFQPRGAKFWGHLEQFFDALGGKLYVNLFFIFICLYSLYWAYEDYQKHYGSYQKPQKKNRWYINLIKGFVYFFLSIGYYFYDAQMVAQGKYQTVKAGEGINTILKLFRGYEIEYYVMAFIFLLSIFAFWRAYRGYKKLHKSRYDY